MKPCCKVALRLALIFFVSCSPVFAESWTIDKPGTAVESVSTKCAEGDYSGTIDVFTGVAFTGKDDRLLDYQAEDHFFNGISLVYKGTKCKDCTSVQFVWRELIRTQD